MDISKKFKLYAIEFVFLLVVIMLYAYIIMITSTDNIALYGGMIIAICYLMAQSIQAQKTLNLVHNKGSQDKINKGIIETLKKDRYDNLELSIIGIFFPIVAGIFMKFILNSENYILDAEEVTTTQLYLMIIIYYLIATATLTSIRKRFVKNKNK